MIDDSFKIHLKILNSVHYLAYSDSGQILTDEQQVFIDKRGLKKKFDHESLRGRGWSIFRKWCFFT
jgi:hypothetical protein